MKFPRDKIFYMFKNKKVYFYIFCCLNNNRVNDKKLTIIFGNYLQRPR